MQKLLQKQPQVNNWFRAKPHISTCHKIPPQNWTKQIKKIIIIYTVPKPSLGFHKSVYLCGWHSCSSLFPARRVWTYGLGCSDKAALSAGSRAAQESPRKRVNLSIRGGAGTAPGATVRLRPLDDFTLRRPNWGTVTTLPLSPTSIKPWRWFERWIRLLRRAPCWDF